MSQSPDAQSGKIIIPQPYGVTTQASGTDSEPMSLIEEEELYADSTRRLGKLVNNSHPLSKRFHMISGRKQETVRPRR